MGKVSRKKRAVQAVRSTPPAKKIEQPEVTAFDGKDALWMGTIGLISFFVYLKTLCPTIYTSEAGENVTAVAILGVPHPPGFPLFCLLGKMFTLLIPFGSIAFRVNLFSATAGAAAAVALYALLRRIHGSKRRPSCALAALLFAFSQTFWSQAVIAEVYTLNALVLCGIFLCIIRWEQGGSILPAALLAGLGLALHPLQVFFFFCWGILIYTSPRRSQLTSNIALKAAVLFVAGTALHFYPLIRSKSNPILDWGNPENLKNLIAYLTASQYRGRMFSLGFTKVWANFLSGLNLLLNEFSFWLIPLPLIGAWFAYKRNRRFLLATLFPAAITIFYAINYNIPWEIAVYYIPVVLVMAFWCSWIPWERIPFPAVVSVLAVLPLMYNYKENDRSKHRIALAYGHDILKTCPEGSTLILPETDATFSILYLTAVEGKRRDVHVWVTGEGGLKTLRDGVNPDVPPVRGTDLLATTQGMVLQTQRVTIETLPGYEQIPYGVLYQILPKGKSVTLPKIDFHTYELEKFVAPLPAFTLDDRSKAILSYYLLSRGDRDFVSGNRPKALVEYATAEKVGGEIAEIRSQLGMRFADAGNKQAAIAQLRKSLAVVEDASVQNRLGRLLVESGRADEALSAFLRAVELDPDLAIAHSNLGALFGMKGDMTRAINQLQKAIQLDPKSILAHNNLARAYLRTGRKDLALSELKISVSIDPSQKEAYQLAKDAGLTL